MSIAMDIVRECEKAKDVNFSQSADDAYGWLVSAIERLAQQQEALYQAAGAPAPPQPGVNYTTWITKDGRVVRIVDMQTQHLLNTIKMLERNAKHEYDHACATAIVWDSEGNEDFLPEYDWFEPPILHLMRREAERRGVKQ